MYEKTEINQKEIKTIKSKNMSHVADKKSINRVEIALISKLHS